MRTSKSKPTFAQQFMWEDMEEWLCDGPHNIGLARIDSSGPLLYGAVRDAIWQRKPADLLALLDEVENLGLAPSDTCDEMRRALRVQYPAK